MQYRLRTLLTLLLLSLSLLTAAGAYADKGGNKGGKGGGKGNDNGGNGGNSGQMINVRGTLTNEGVECQALRGDDGELYTLTGDLSGFEEGDRVKVRGTVAEISICQQGTTIEVQSIKDDKSQGNENRARVVRITGTLTDAGVECQALETENGTVYTLTGNLRDFEVGDRVRVVGKVAEVSICQQGTTLQVLNIRPARQ
jgi:hypothetical protein